MRYFIWFSYDGTAYHGWQIQPNGITVQSELQRCLSLLLQQKVSVTGAGRTDTGVHARRMAAHFDTEQPLDTQLLKHKLNGLLHQDIGIYDIHPVADDIHARFSATARTYHYYVHTRKDPFLRQYSLELHYQLDYELMNQAGRILMVAKQVLTSKLHSVTLRMRSGTRRQTLHGILRLLPTASCVIWSAPW